jgi:hypothetical protein
VRRETERIYVCILPDFSFVTQISPLSLCSLSHCHDAGAVAVRPDGGATAPELKTSPKTQLFKSKLNPFLCLLRIRNPKIKKRLTEQTDRRKKR